MSVATLVQVLNRRSEDGETLVNHRKLDEKYNSHSRTFEYTSGLEHVAPLVSPGSPWYEGL